MSQEAMKLALEALRNSVFDEHTADETFEAIKALEEALAKQEQGEPVACDNCKKLEDELEPLRIKAELWKRDAIVWKSAYDVEVGFREQEQGEPVAWVCNGVNNTHDIDFDENDVNALPVGTLLYTTPQQPSTIVRTWVGLTEEEANELWESTDSDWELMKRVEAKLKEKNT